jgi:hypothetical protein
MKTTVALFIALVTLLPDSANATTLTITSGSAVLNQEFGPGGEGSVISFLGNDFSVYQGQEPNSFILTPAFGVQPFVEFIPFYTGLFRGVADVRVGTQHCYGNDFESCGDITFTSPGFAMPADWPSNTPFVATVPFTATGQLLVGGNQYDIAGQGTVTGTSCLTPCGPLLLRARLEYSFSVGEPPSLVLMLVSTIAIGIASLSHKWLP